MEINLTDGYWILSNNENILSGFGENYNIDRTYNLEKGSNLISYPSTDSVEVSYAIPDSIESLVIGIISEGGSAFNDDYLGWIGSTQFFKANKGYWFLVSDDISFNYETEGVSRSNFKVYEQTLPYDEKFTVNQSPQQAFYYIDKIHLEKEALEVGDWIMTYNGSVITGIRQWKGSSIDIPAMGYFDLSKTHGYFKHGDIPTFKLLKQSTGEIIVLDGDIPAWESNRLFRLSSLSEKVLAPQELSLINAYPNPFNPITTIKFGMPNDMNLSIQIFNLEGRLVDNLFDGFKSSGYHKLEWDGTNHPSGLYFIKIVAGNYVNTQKLMLVK